MMTDVATSKDVHSAAFMLANHSLYELSERMHKLAVQMDAATVNEPINLAVIRHWPDGFHDRLSHVWQDLLGFIPNYKLYDLQRVLGEFGFKMEVYEVGVQGESQPDLKIERATPPTPPLEQEVNSKLNGRPLPPLLRYSWFQLREVAAEIEPWKDDECEEQYMQRVIRRANAKF